MRRFFKQDISGDTILVTGQEAKHISRVLRMQEGDMLILFDGSGMEYLCRISGMEEEGVTVCVEEKKQSDRELPVNITLCQAVIKSDHLDYVVQKCTEAGVFAFLPFLSERCVKRPDEKSAHKLWEKEKRVALEAAKQCGRARVPEVSRILSFEELKAEVLQAKGLKLLAYENEKNTTIKEVLKQNPAQDILLIIGPEGGFSEREVRGLCEAGAVACTLGKLILRAETAGLVAAAMISYEAMGN